MKTQQQYAIVLFLQSMMMAPCLINGWITTTATSPRLIHNKRSQSILHMALGPGGGRQSKKQVDEMLEFIYEPTTESVDQSKVDSGPPSADTLAPLVRVIAKAADMRKADDIVAMRIAKLSTVAGFIVICCGNSRPQNQAIAAAIKDDVAEEFDGEHSLLGNGVPEGNADSGWILLDYGDIMVHIMTPKSRLFYDIEGQWREKGGEYMDLSDVLLPDSKTSSQTGGSGTMEGISEEDDPFWS